MILQAISHYNILNRLGSGGMGEVYLAYDTKLDRRVAIKLLSQESVADEQSKKRLIREARAAAKLDHPNICAIYEVGEENGISFIVMQYVEGETLADSLRSKPLNLREGLDIAIQVTDALAEAHSHSIIHRDIKPQNMMITARGQVKVLDFGLAKKMHEGSLQENKGEAESVLTSPGLVIGTVPYMSPEQARGESLDGRSDIFSLGTVLYEIVTGRHPFRTDSVAATIAAILMREPPPLNQFNQSIPHELQQIVSRALRKEKEERYKSANDLLLDLRGLREQPEIKNDQVQFTLPIWSDRATTIVAIENQAKVDTPKIAAVQSTEIRPLTTSGIKAFASEINSRKRGKILALTIFFIVTAIVLAVVVSLRIGRNKQETASTDMSTQKQIVPSIRSFPFDMVKLDKNGKVLERRQKYARFFSEDLASGVTLDMVEIPSGTFLMGTSDSEVFPNRNNLRALREAALRKTSGDPNETPQHQVSLPIFYISKFEVTQAQWRAVASLPKVNRELTPDPSYLKGDNLPVEQVSWKDAIEYCARLSQKTGRNYRLPSEAEWEYACRAGTTTPFAFGQTVTKQFVNFFDYTDFDKPISASSKEEREKKVKAHFDARLHAMRIAKTTPVGSLGAIGDSVVANAFGLFDMCGNVSEWCLDAWHENYDGAPIDGSAWEDIDDTNGEILRVIRGGNCAADLIFCRSAARSRYLKGIYRSIGFRVVLVRT